jgi:dTDP-4-amino-4,6-dideoxygalactose transaminase
MAELVPQAAPGLRVARHRDEIAAAIARVVAGGQYILGAECEAFEHEFARFLGAPYAIGVNSGTDALSLAMLALGIAPGDEVIVPALTHAGTAVAAQRIGASVRFVDVERVTRGIDPAAFAAAISPRTAAVIVVHLHGAPAMLTDVQRIAAARGLAVIEDCAHAHGATIGDQTIGTFGDAAAFSFYPTKNLGAAGDAGLVTTEDPDLGARLRRIRVHGMEPKYFHAEIGGNFRLDEIQAAVLRVKLRRLAGWNRRRAEIAGEYRRLLAGPAAAGKLALPVVGAGRDHIYHQYVIRVPERDAVRARLTAAGVGCEVYYPVPLHLQECFRSLGGRPGDLPVSERAAEEVLALPIWPELSGTEIAAVAAAVSEAVS